MNAASLVLVKSAVRTFGARRALKGIDLAVERGDFVALIGPSGSGKSTLLRAIGGLQVLDPGGGSVEVFGHKLQSGGRLAPEVRTLRRSIGFIFQHFNLVGRLSLFTNVALGSLGRLSSLRSLLGLWPADVRQAVGQALERVGIQDQAGQRANSLSGGQQQRGAIARTLVQQAELILADEPVASLDPVSARKVMETLATLNEEDARTVIVSLHHVEIARRYCRRVVALKSGEIIYDGAPGGLSPAVLSEIYGSEFEDVYGEVAKP